MNKTLQQLIILLAFLPGALHLSAKKNADAPNFMPLQFTIQDGNASVGEELCISITAENFVDILGMQFSIAFDPGVLEFQTIKNSHSDLRIDEDFLTDNFGFPGAGSVPTNRITFVWEARGLIPVNLNNGTVLFDLCFTVKNTSQTTVDIGDNPTPIQVVQRTGTGDIPIDFTIQASTVNGPVSGSGPTANFTANQLSVVAGQSVTFSDASTGNPTSWSWTFDGAAPPTSTNQNPTVSFNVPGTYSVSLTVTNADGSDTETKSNFITVTPTFENFTLDVTDIQGEVGEEVCVSIKAYKFVDILGLQFTLQYDKDVLEFVSVGNFESMLRIDEDFLNENFGFPGQGVIPQGKITFLWNARGNQPVTLPDGTTLFDVCFTVKTTEETTITFTDNPTDIQVIQGDGNGGEETIDFDSDGGTVNGSDISANFVASSTDILVGQTINFTDLSSPTPTSWSWSFPGGSPGSSTAQNPSVTYSVPGTYSVTLQVTGNEGTDTETKTGFITVRSDEISFDVFTIDITDTRGNIGEEVCVSINGYKFTDILGLQFTLLFDNNVLEFSQLGNINDALNIDPDFLDENFGLPGQGALAENKLTFLWTARGNIPVTLADGETLFDVCFTVKSIDETSITFTDDPTTIQAIQSVNNEEVEIDFNGDDGVVNGVGVINISSVNITDVPCKGGSNGAIDLTVQGGTNMVFQWNFENRTTEDLIGIPAGQYSVTITDAETNSIAMASYTVNEGSAEVIINDITETDIDCFGENNGAINVSAT